MTKHNRDVELIKSFVYFCCGNCNIGGDCVDFVVTIFSDITDIILPYFSKYPLHGCKRLDFLDFLRVVEIMQSKAHITGGGTRTNSYNKIRNEQRKMCLIFHYSCLE